VDYQELLAELENDRENIERMIAWLRTRMQRAEAGSTPDHQVENSSKPGPSMPRRYVQGIASDAFFRMPVPQAIKTFLNMAKRPTTAKEITAALDSGGLTHQAKNLYATVYPTLLRLEDAGEVVRVSKGKWGLAEWYPSGRKPGPSEKLAEAE